MSGRVKTSAIAAALGLSRKSVLRRAEAEGWPRVQKPGGILWAENRLPMDVRLALANGGAAGEGRDNAAALAGQVFCQATEKERQTASLRGGLIAEYRLSGLRKEDFITAYNNGGADSWLYKNLGPVSLRTFYRWEREFSRSGLGGLAPRYSAASGGAGESLTDTEKALLERFWLRDSRPTIRHALRLLQENYPGARCTYQTARRYLQSLPRALVDYRRLGRTAFTNKHQPYMDQNIWQYQSLDVVVSDHHCLDCVVMYHGKLVRPWVTTMQDYRSGKVLGWCPSVAPSSLSIIAAYYMAVIQHGVPRKLVFDNGKDYHSEILNGKTVNAKVYTPEAWDEEKEIYIQGLFYMIGSEVSFTLPYNGKSKGRQERYYGVLKENFSKDIGSFIGGDARERPEDSELYFRAVNGMAKRNDVPVWEEAVNALAAMISYINEELPSAGKGMNGKTASRVFSENLPADVRYADRDTLRLALSKGELRQVRNNVVLINGVTYYHPDLIYYSGQQVIVRSLLTTDEEALICDLQGRALFNARANYFFEGEDLDAASKRLRGAQKLNLLRLAEMGTGEVQAAPEYETMVQVALNKYRQAAPVDLAAYLAPPEEALPLAAGAEHQSIKPGPEAPKNPKRILKNPLDAKPEDYI
jgi:hypothetical protein